MEPEICRRPAPIFASLAQTRFCKGESAASNEAAALRDVTIRGRDRWEATNGGSGEAARRETRPRFEYAEQDGGG